MLVFAAFDTIVPAAGIVLIGLEARQVARLAGAGFFGFGNSRFASINITCSIRWRTLRKSLLHQPFNRDSLIRVCPAGNKERCKNYQQKSIHFWPLFRINLTTDLA